MTIDYDILARRIASFLAAGNYLAPVSSLALQCQLRLAVERSVSNILREALPTSETRETGWLIERNRERGPEWATFWKFGVVWTKDSIQACRFCRREDAEQWAGGLDYDNITEHTWS